MFTLVFVGGVGWGGVGWGGVTESKDEVVVCVCV